MAALQIFVYLQLLDLVTTLIGFRAGASEASPFISQLIRTSSPELGVAASKLLALAIACFCWSKGRSSVIAKINYWFAALIVWNLAIILRALPAR